MLTPIEQMAQSFHSPNSEFSVPSLLIDNSTPDSAQQPWGIAEMYVSAMTEMSLPGRIPRGEIKTQVRKFIRVKRVNILQLRNA